MAPAGDKVFLLKQSSKKGWVKVLTSSYQDQHWSKPALLFKYKQASWQSGAYVSPSEDLLIFPMQGKDSYGEEDLYAVTRDSSGRWSDPINLGASINTEGTEIAPFLYQGNLFFASDGHAGFGGFDIFSAHQLYNSWKTWSAPSNVGNEINTPGYEAFMSLYDDGEVYFSGERSGQTDIFRTAYRTDTDFVQVAEPVDERGGSDIPALKKLLQGEKGLIFFDAGSDQLAPKYKELLFYIYTMIDDQANIAITLIGHADQEGDRNYNTELSRKRAVSAKNYLLSLGMEEERLKVIARGENDPLVVDFSREAMRKNRRVQIVLGEGDVDSQASHSMH